ncbi:hypothetical protein ACFCX0_42330 [Streptomyces sp. NPDC056352]|uniref:hypothetical protein n=1 Tax=Streptomyces sp. NPDC056352 TaxID=3345791 RepID=UPI0035DA095D
MVCRRIGSCFERPKDTRMLSTWLSLDDCARLVEAALSAPEPGFRIAWGVSANTRGVFSLDEARSLGYEPQGDAERYAADTPAGYRPGRRPLPRRCLLPTGPRQAPKPSGELSMTHPLLGVPQRVPRLQAHHAYDSVYPGPIAY